MITLAKLRFEHKKMKQDVLASLLHVDRSTVSKWENGKQVPDRETAMRIAEIFNVPFVEVEKMFLKQQKQAENQPEWQHKQIAMDLADDRGGVCPQ